MNHKLHNALLPLNKHNKPDKRFIVATAKRTNDDYSLTKKSPIIKRIEKGFTIGRNHIRNVRPGLVAAIIKAENPRYDVKAEGKEMDVKGRTIKGGKIQGRGLAQVVPSTAKGTPIGKARWKNKTNAEVAKILKENPDLNVAVAAQFLEQLHTVFKKNQYTKNWSERDFELLMGTAYNNKGESFVKVINTVKPKNFKDLLNRAGNYTSGQPRLEAQTRRLINRLEKSLNEFRPKGGKKLRPSGKEKIKPNVRNNPNLKYRDPLNFQTG